MATLVLWWRYSDGSGAGVSRVYLNADQQAEADLALLKDHQNVDWHLTPADLVQGISYDGAARLVPHKPKEEGADA